jgi:hypothetical protein
MSVSLARNLSKQPGKRFENTIVISGNRRSQRDGKLSGGLAPLPGVARVRALEAIHMPRVAARPLLSSLCRFPHASPLSPSWAGKQKTAPKDRSKQLISLRELGAGEGIRTLDPNLGKVAIISAATSRLPTPFCGGRPSPPISENTVLITVLNLRLERCGSRNLLILLARPKRFELLTPRFVVSCFWRKPAKTSEKPILPNR